MFKCLVMNTFCESLPAYQSYFKLGMMLSARMELKK